MEVGIRSNQLHHNSMVVAKFLFDLIDRIGGYSFEVTTPSEVEKRLLEKGFVLIEMKTVGSKLGCNECLW